MRIKQGADFGEATPTSVVNVGGVNTVKLGRKLVRRNIGPLHSSNFAPANNPGVGVKLDNALGRTQIHTRCPPITRDEGKLNLVNQDVRNLHWRATFPKLAASG